jgi:hypothetical protein
VEVGGRPVRRVGRWRCSRWREEEERGHHPGGPAAPIGPKPRREIPSEIKLDFAKDLEICTRRFRRNFDVRIFPKLS